MNLRTILSFGFLILLPTALLGLFSNSADAANLNATSEINKIKSGDSFAPFEQDTLPFPPDSIYKYISSTSEQLLGKKELPRNLSVDQWRADLDSLAAALKRRTPYFEAAYGSKLLGERLDSLKKHLPRMSRDQRIMSVYRLFRFPAAGTGHNRINPAQRVLGWRAIPLWAYRFSDGVYIMAAENEELVGAELLMVGDTPVGELYQTFSAYTNGDNQWHRERRLEEQFLRWANPLKADGFINDLQAVPVTVRTPSGEVRKLTIPTYLPSSEEWVRFRTSLPQVPASLQWSPAAEYQDNSEPFYRLTYRDSTKLLHFEFNTVLNESDFDAFSDYSIADMADSIKVMADTYPINKVVIDLRTNSGGNAGLNAPLIKAIKSHPKINQRGKLFTLISWRTYSAAGLLAMELEKQTKTLFVGEPGGFAPNIWGEYAPYTLPNSNITAMISYAYYQSGMNNSQRTFIDPDIYVPLSSKQHFKNIDSTMIAVRNYNHQKRQSISLSPGEEQKYLGYFELSPLHTVSISKTKSGLNLTVLGEGFPMRIHNDNPPIFLETDLHPTSSKRLSTDISDVFIIYSPTSQDLTLDWKGQQYPLKPLEGKRTAPIDHLRNGDLKEAAEGIRHLLSSGMMLGNNYLEAPLTSYSDRLLEQGKPKEALNYVKLAAEFSPQSWRVHADHAEVYHVLGDDKKALQILQKVKRLYPNQYPEMLKYLNLNEPQ